MIASASLKPVGGGNPVDAAAPRFRGLIASASLKPEQCGGFAHPCHGRIPRLDCLGLIEACSCGHFRTACLAIPRLDCLGLIEAAEHSIESVGDVRFRGLIASASLKLTKSYLYAQDKVEIPRLDCLGLIEAFRKIGGAISAHGIPRLDCLGLIEATDAPALDAGGPSAIPRLDCLGLIEATTYVVRCRRGVLDSEA